MGALECHDKLSSEFSAVKSRWSANKITDRLLHFRNRVELFYIHLILIKETVKWT